MPDEPEVFCPSTGKVAYSSELRASAKKRLIIASGRKKKKANLNVYQCWHCGCWHLGNKESRRHQKFRKGIING